MAASTEQKLDYLLKKIGYTASKTGIAEDETGISGTKKAPFAEPIPSPLTLPGANVWAQSNQIPTTPPGANTSIVRVYKTGTAQQLTFDNTVSGNRSFVARETVGEVTSAVVGDWIDTQFGADYIVKVYKGEPGTAGVTTLFAAGSGNDDTWFFDYSAGVLNFNGTNVPSGITTTNVYIEGYRYTGIKGITGVAQTFTDLEVSGITTFNGAVDMNSTLDVDGHTELDNVNVSGVSTFKDDVEFHGALGITSVSFDKSDNSLKFVDNAKLKLGDGGDLELYHDGDQSYIKDNGTGQLYIQGSAALHLENSNGNKKYFRGVNGGTAELYYDGNKKIETTNEGVLVSGGTTTGTLNVNGHTDLDNVSIAGVTTISNDLHIESTSPAIYLTDTNHDSDWAIKNSDGTLIFRDQTLGNIRFEIYPGNSPTIRPFIKTDYLTDARFDGFVRIGGEGNSPDHSLTVGGSSNFSGIVTFANNIDANGNLDVDGDTELDQVNVSAASTFGGLVDIDAGGQANTFKVEDLTDNRLVIAGTGGELEDTTKLTFDGSTLAVVGDATFSGNVTIGGTLIKEDITNIDSIGIVTAGRGVRVTAGGLVVSSGLGTFSDSAYFPDNSKIKFGDATTADLEIYHSGAHSFISDQGTGSLKLLTSTLQVKNAGDSATMITAVPGSTGSTKLYQNNDERLATTREGVLVSGGTTTGTLSVTGVSTFSDNTIIDGSLTVGSNHSSMTGGAPTDAGNLAVYGSGRNSLIIQTDNNASDRGIAWRNSGDAYVAHISAVNRGDSQADLRFGVSNNNSNVDLVSERMRITKEGNVGINSSAPGAKLDVRGTVQVSGISTFNDDVRITGGGLNVVGVATATTFSGDISGVGATFTNITGTLQTAAQTNITSVGTLGALTVSGNINANGNIIGDDATNISGINSVTATTFYGSSTGLTGIANANIASDAAIQGTKISPNFGSQNIVTTGDFNSGSVTITGGTPAITFTDNNNDPDYYIQNNNGALRIYDATNSAERFVVNANGSITLGTGSTIGALTGVTTYYGDGSNLTGVSTAGINTEATSTFETIVVNGNAGIGSLNVTGISTFTGNIDANGDLDVDGHTDLDNVSIAGVTTMSGDLTISSSFPRLKLTDTDNNSDFSVDNGNGTFRVRDVTNGDNRFTIDSSGQVNFSENVNIVGTTTTGQLAVTGVSTFTGDLDVNGNIAGDNATAITGILRMAGSGAAAMALQNVQYVGRGTDPYGSSFLHLNDQNIPTFGGGGNFTTLASISGLNLIYDTNNNDNNGLIIGSGSTDTSLMTTHMVVSHQGRVGIGTTSPESLLSLYTDADGEDLIHFDMGSPSDRRGWKFKQGSTGTSSRLVLQADENGKAFEIQNSSGDEQLYVYAASSNPYVRIDPELHISDTILHVGDQDTKIRFPAADTFSVETAGSERLRIKSDGKIGINTTTPSTLLQIVGSTASADSSGGTLGIRQKGDTINDGITLTSSHANSARFYKDSDGALHIYNTGGSSDDFVLSNSGNVGIGTDDPAQKFHIDNHTSPSDTGGILVQNVLYSSNQDKPYLTIGTQNWTGATTNWNTYGFQHRIKSDGSGIPRITIDNSSGEIICFNSARKVGIGTINPNAPLDVFSNTAATDEDLFMVRSSTGAFAVQCSNVTAANPEWRLRTYSNEPIVFSPGNVEKVRITKDGEVGIGTDSPDSKLTVSADSAQAIIELKRTNTNGGTGSYGAINWTALDGHSVANISAKGDGDDNGAHLVFRTTSAAASNDPYNAATVERLRITSAGRVGIGTDSPDAPLHILSDANNMVQIESTDRHSTLYLIDTIGSSFIQNDSGELRFGVGGGASAAGGETEAVRIDSDGKFGIGTDNPTSKLHVIGDAVVSGVVTATDFDATSDIRLKTNVKPIDDPIAKVVRIDGVSFNWKKDDRPALGVIADQVEKVLPQLVHGDDPKTVNYNGLVGLLIEVVKDQQKQIDSLNDRISKLE